MTRKAHVESVRTNLYVSKAFYDFVMERALKSRRSFSKQIEYMVLRAAKRIGEEEDVTPQ